MSNLIAKYRGFSIVSVMVVLVIISILATVGHTEYVAYTTRAKVTEGLKVLEEFQAIANGLRAKTGVIAPYYVLFSDGDTNGFVSGTTTGDSAVKQLNFRYVDTVSADRGTVSGNKYILIGVGFQNDSYITAGADHMYLYGIETANGGFNWQCGKSSSKANNLADQYLPKTCLASIP